MEENKQHIWHIMPYYFMTGKNTIDTHKQICAVYGEGAVTDQKCQTWFAKFCDRDFSVYNTPQSGRLVKVDSNQIKTLIKNNQCSTTEKIASILKISKSIQLL